MEKPNGRSLVVVLLGLSIVVAYGTCAWLRSHRSLSDRLAPSETKRNGQTAAARPAAVAVPRAIVAQVNGIKGSISAPHGQPVALGESFISAQEESLLQLESPDAGATVKWTDSRLALLRGTGVTTLTVSGFSHLQGRLQATFQRKKGAEFRIKVPGAYLAILGTTIAFHLNQEGGGLILLEGQVTINPDEQTQQPFDMQPGQALQITATGPVMLPAIPADWLTTDDEWSRSVTRALTQLEPKPVAEAPDQPDPEPDLKQGTHFPPLPHEHTLDEQDNPNHDTEPQHDDSTPETSPEPVHRQIPPSAILRQHGR